MSISFDKELFRTRHLGPDPQQVTEMLSAIKADSLQQLMEETIPAQIRLKKPLNLPDALSEEEYLDYLRNEIASKNKIYRSEEHTSELQSRGHLVCRLLLEKKKVTGNENT